MKKKSFVYKNSGDPRILVYVHETQLFRGAILNFAHAKSYILMTLFLAGLFLPLAGIFCHAGESLFPLATLWGCLWAVLVYLYCMNAASGDLKKYPGKRSFRE